MTDRLRRNVDFLRMLAKGNSTKRKRLLACAHKDLIQCISECALNVLKGNVKLSSVDLKRIKRHRKLVRTLAEKKTALKKKRELLIQKGGGLPALLIPILTLVSTLLLK